MSNTIRFEVDTGGIATLTKRYVDAIEGTSARILDTRSNVGFSGPPASGTSAKLQVTGVVPTQLPGDVLPVNVEVVPSSATNRWPS